MTPGQAPVRMDGLTLDELVMNTMRDGHTLWISLYFYEIADHIEPIEDEE